MIGNYSASGLQTNFTQAGTLWVNTDSGSDATGVRGDPLAPFKTLNGAYAASLNSTTATDAIIIKATKYPVANNITNGDLTIAHPIQIIGEVTGPNSPHQVTDDTITVTNNARNNVYFDNITFVNSVLDAPCLLIQNSQDHVVWLRRCYFARTTGTKYAVELTGAWPTSGTVTHPVQVVMEQCDLVGKIHHAAGTVGSPFDKKGILVIKDHFKSLVGATNFAYASELVIDSGYVFVDSPSSMMPVTLNGGCLEVANSSPYPGLNATDYAIVCTATDTLGKSFLFMRNCSNFSVFMAPNATNLGKISIGANVIYSLENVHIPAANIEIDAGAVELNTWLVNNSKPEFVNFSSGKVYGAGALLT